MPASSARGTLAKAGSACRRPAIGSAVAFQPGNGSRALAAIRELPRPNFLARVFVSNDSGATWSPVEGLEVASSIPIQIAFAPSAPETVYASSQAGMYRSRDGGLSFVRVSSPPPGIAFWSTVLWVSPTDPELLLAGGVSLWRSFDGGESWAPFDYRDERRRRAGDGLLLGGTQDRGMVSAHAGSSRSTLEAAGDGVCALMDPDQGG